MAAGEFGEAGGRGLGGGEVGGGLLACAFHGGGGFLAGLVVGAHSWPPSP